DVAIAANERQLAGVRAQPLDAPDEQAEGGRVDESRVGEVDHDLLRALGDHVEKLLLELRRRVEVDLARERDHVRGVGELLGLDVEVHVAWAPGARVYRCDFRAAWSCCTVWRTVAAFGLSGAIARNRLYAFTAVARSLAFCAAPAHCSSAFASFEVPFEASTARLYAAWPFEYAVVVATYWLFRRVCSAREYGSDVSAWPICEFGSRPGCVTLFCRYVFRRVW